MSGFKKRKPPKWWDLAETKRHQFQLYFTQRNLMLLTLRLKGSTFAALGGLVGLSASRVQVITKILKRHFDRALKEKLPEAEFIKRWIAENNLQEHFADVD